MGSLRGAFFFKKTLGFADSGPRHEIVVEFVGQLREALVDP